MLQEHLVRIDQAKTISENYVIHFNQTEVTANTLAADILAKKSNATAEEQVLYQKLADDIIVSIGIYEFITNPALEILANLTARFYEIKNQTAAE